jgi:hypothetical protein
MDVVMPVKAKAENDKRPAERGNGQRKAGLDLMITGMDVPLFDSSGVPVGLLERAVGNKSNASMIRLELD